MTRTKLRIVAALAAGMAGVFLAEASTWGDEKAPPKAREVTVAQAVEEMEWTPRAINNRKRTIDISDFPTPPKQGVAAAVKIISTKEGLAVTGFVFGNLGVDPEAAITLDGKPAKWED